MAYTLEFHPEAEIELDEAIGWYKEQKQGLEQEFYSAYLETENRVGTNPLQFQKVLDEVRSANLKRFPFSIYFEVENSEKIFIYAIFHQKRNPEDWQKRL